MTVDKIVDDLLSYDFDPPYPEFSHSDFVAAVAKDLSTADCEALLVTACRRLPATIAADILEGMLSAVNLHLSMNRFLDLIALGREVSLAGHIVGLGLQHTGESASAFATAIMQRLSGDVDKASCDRYAYGLWALMNQEVCDVQNRVIVRSKCDIDSEQIQRLAHLPQLTDYARQVLRSCISQSKEKGDAAQ